MSVKLKLQPFSAPLSKTEAIDFSLDGFNPEKSYRVSFENATLGRLIPASGLERGSIVDGKISLSGVSSLNGKINLVLYPSDTASVISVYANIEEKTESETWRLSDIAACSFQIENVQTHSTTDRVAISPAFVGPNQKAVLKVHTSPNSNLQIVVNNKRFIVKSNQSGEGSMSFRAIDVISGSASSAKTVQKFPVYFAKADDDYKTVYDSGSFFHFVPESMKALAATNDPSTPECAILDPTPGQGLTLKKLDDFCVEGAVVGDLTVFDSGDSASSFYNSKVGFCSPTRQIYPTSSTDPVCRIYNSTSSVLLNNGAGLVVFSSQETFASDPYTFPTLSSRVFVAHIPTSLKYKGNPVRDGTVIAPPKFYHTATPLSLSANETYSIQFRLEDGNLFEVRYTTISSSITEFVAAFVGLINADISARAYNISAVDLESFIEIKSNDRFSIRTQVVSGNGTFTAKLKSNKTLDVLVSPEAISDGGNTLVFLFPKIGYQSHDIVTRDYTNNIIRISVPSGFNNDVGPNIYENLYCEKFVVVDADTELPETNLIEINPLPYIYDIFSREVSCVYPVIAVRTAATGEEIAYVVCEAPVNGIYQLFLYSFRLGSAVENTEWKQLTQDGENKNARIACDSIGNLHIVWESDRLGATQLYYSVLGPSSRSINNQCFMSAVDKAEAFEMDQNILSVSNPTAIQTKWTRILSGNGKASVVNLSKIVISGNPQEDAAMTYFTLAKDEFGQYLPSYFGQLSFQLSFNLQIEGLPPNVLNDETIQSQFDEWKAEFVPAGDHKYTKDGNTYTIDAAGPYFDNIIPICGSYKLSTSDLTFLSGGATADGYSHNDENIYATASEGAVLSHPANVRHYMLAIMPEKIRFKAKNTEAFFQYCDRLGVSEGECDGFLSEIEYKKLTGRFKLVLILATSENETSGQLAKKQYTISRLFGDYVDFSTTKNIKIGVHYSKMGSDFIDGILKRDKEAFAYQYRFYGDIMVAVDNKTVLGQSFLADFSDQYGKFDIALGMPKGAGFVSNESLPYQGDLYEDMDITQVFTNVAVGPHSMQHNTGVANFSLFDRNTYQMVVPEQVHNVLGNGSFEETVFAKNLVTYPDSGSEGITGWMVNQPISYYQIPKADQVGLFFSLNGDAWISLSGYTGGSTSGTLTKGKISQSIPTSIGKKYYIFFNISSFPSTDTAARNISRTVQVTAGAWNASFVITSANPAVHNWQKRTMSFVASTATTSIVFENTSSAATYAPHIDNIVIVAEEDLNNETISFTTAQNLLVDQAEFDLNYSLYATNEFSQIPITLSTQYQNKTADLAIDKIDKVHVAWQSNRNGYWDIYYSGSRERGAPFRFETQITNSESNSVNPSISIDGKGRRLIAWQDNRYGNNQILAAISKTTDQMLVDRCKQDEIDEFLYEWNSNIDPVFDPYTLPISQLNCGIEFEFTAPTNNQFHFNLLFYEDREYQTLYKTISSSANINGWRIDDTQLPYNGVTATAESSYVVSYSPSYEDGLSDKVLYVVAQFQINANPIDISKSTNIQIVHPYSGLNLKSTRYEANNLIRAFLEFNDETPVGINPQGLSFFNVSPVTGVSFASPLTKLPGAKRGDRVKSILLHFDPIGSAGEVSATITFTSPIVAMFTSGSSLVSSKRYFGVSGVTYHETTGAGLEAIDTLQVSADRKTLTIYMTVDPAIDEIRVILQDDTESIGENEFVYYCPITQSSRCDVNCSFINNHNSNKNVHFRVSFYADAERTNPIMSSFSKVDSLGWKSGSTPFPAGGLLVTPSQEISAIYVPEILPFEMYESQIKMQNGSIIRQSLLCGVTYYVTIESVVDNIFTLENQFQFICPCSKTDSDLWRKDRDSSTWVCSGQGFDDFRISQTDNRSLFPKVKVTDFDLFYIVWQDYRYTRILSDQGAISPDYFMALYDPVLESFTCSGQGGYDRRLTTYKAGGKSLYDASIFVDQFQNLNLVAHDGFRVYAQSCTLGCKFESLNSDLILPCMFTDETDSSFFVVGGAPDRDVAQYQKIRISGKYIAFSTYLDLQSPIPVINDCFIELDILGVPGTYAYRLKNENDEDWTEWLPIGPDLPSQSQTDTASTEAERSFFRAFFTQRNRFTAPWVASAGNGTKKVCCEILTFFGKTETFCVDFMAIYDNLDYKIDLFFDSAFTKPVPKFKNYMVVSEFSTPTLIDDENLGSINEAVTQETTIYARIEFKDKKKIQLLEKLQTVDRLSLSNKLTMSVYQQGLSDQLGLAMTKIAEGVYSSSFVVMPDDGICNIDGLAVIVVDVPGQCKPLTFDDLAYRVENILSSRSLDQKVSVFNNFTVFRDKYLGDDIKGSFGSPDYYKIRKFGLGETTSKDFGSTKWIGGGEGPLNNDTGFIPPSTGDAGTTGGGVEGAT